MKKLALLVIGLFLTLSYSNAQSAQPTAFPGAEGGGMYTTGGRGGKVLYVTRLDDDNNPGSLRWAVSQDYPRTILFKVSGEIPLRERLTIKHPDVTIAGQTAPGDGICISNFGMSVQADNVIIRFLRFRMGDRIEAAKEEDALGGRYLTNVIVDHCSMSWSTDECVSFYGCKNFTLQWNVLAESLRISLHEKGRHGFGGIWGGKNASFHHNLIACHDSRNPRFDHPLIYIPNVDTADFRGAVDMRNNVVYNWGTNVTYGGEDGQFNMVGNYYKPGPASGSGDYFIQRWGRVRDLRSTEEVWMDAHYPNLYMEGNVMEGNPAITEDNFKGVVDAKTGGAPGKRLTSPLPINGRKDGSVTTHTAEQAFELVLKYAGMSLMRDTVDRRVCGDAFLGINSVKNGGRGSTGGLIDDPMAVGGWPAYKSSPAPADTDEDGIPDEWEDDRGLNKNDPSDSGTYTLDPNYTNLEIYINSLISKIIEAQNRCPASEL